MGLDCTDHLEQDEQKIIIEMFAVSTFDSSTTKPKEIPKAKKSPFYPVLTSQCEDRDDQEIYTETAAAIN